MVTPMRPPPGDLAVGDAQGTDCCTTAPSGIEPKEVPPPAEARGEPKGTSDTPEARGEGATRAVAHAAEGDAAVGDATGA